MTQLPSIDLFSALNLCGGVQGLIFASILVRLENVRHEKPDKLANRYLATLLSILGALSIHRFLWKSGYISVVPLVTDVMMILGVLIPPTLYLYVRTMTLANSKQPNWFWIGLPLCLVWFFQLPAHFSSVETKVALVNNSYTEQTLPLLLVVSFRIYVVLAQLLFAVYLVLAFKLLFAHTKNIRHFFSYRENIELAWARNLLLVSVCFLLAIVILYILLPFFGDATSSQTRSKTAWMFALTDIFFASVIFYAGIMGILQTRIYNPSDFSDVEFKTIVSENPEPTDPDNRGNGNKYKKSSLDEAQTSLILGKLREVMQQQKPHLQNDLTLPDLAKLIPASPNHLSQVINSELQMSFFDFINGYRIELAKELLRSQEPESNTILGVALKSSFNSKSAFYSAFKKNTGLTPTEYRQQHIGQ